MNRSRLIALAVLVGLTGLGLTFLMAANGSGAKDAKGGPEAPKLNGKGGLVVFGNVDIEDPLAHY